MRALARLLSHVNWESAVLTVQDLLGPLIIRLQQLLIDNTHFKEGEDYNVLLSELRLLSSVFLLVDNPDHGMFACYRITNELKNNLTLYTRLWRKCGQF